MSEASPPKRVAECGGCSNFCGRRVAGGECVVGNGQVLGLKKLTSAQGLVKAWKTLKGISAQPQAQRRKTRTYGRGVKMYQDLLSGP